MRPTKSAFQRVGHLRTFRLPGGEVAVHEPRRTALGLLHEVLGEALFDRTELAPVRAFSQQERTLLRTMLARDVNAPITSSAGRLFDAVAAILGLRQVTRFEGQVALELEYALAGVESEERYSFEVVDGSRSLKAAACPTLQRGVNTVAIVDWAPMVREILGAWRVTQRLDWYRPGSIIRWRRPS